MFVVAETGERGDGRLLDRDTVGRGERFDLVVNVDSAAVQNVGQR